MQHSRNIARKKLPRVFIPNVNETKDGSVRIDTKYSISTILGFPEKYRHLHVQDISDASIPFDTAHVTNVYFKVC